MLHILAMCGSFYFRESSVPVWSDTLQPVGLDLASVIQRAHTVNYRSDNGPKMGTSLNLSSGKSISPVAAQKQVPRPPRPSPKSGARVTHTPPQNVQSVLLPTPTLPPRSHDQPADDIVESSPHSVSDSGHGEFTALHSDSDVVMTSAETPLNLRQTQRQADVESLPDTEADELQEAAIEFLRR